MFRFLPLFLILLALPAMAAEVDWIEGCNVDGSRDLNTSPVVTTLNPGDYACAESGTQTDVTDELDVSQCDHIDVMQFTDPNGDGDDSLVSGVPEICSDLVDDDDSCNSMGLTAFSGNTFLEGLGARFFRVASAGTTDASANVRWEVRCVGRARE